jgi:hypothetical protein
MNSNSFTRTCLYHIIIEDVILFIPGAEGGQPGAEGGQSPRTPHGQHGDTESHGSHDKQMDDKPKGPVQIAYEVNLSMEPRAWYSMAQNKRDDSI